MDRREAVRLVGAFVAIPFLPGAVGAAAVLAERTHARVQGGAGFRTFNGTQQALVSALCDAIIPRTETPGAIDVRVPEFIDHIVTDWADDAERRVLLAGLADIDRRAAAGGGSAFVMLDATRQAEILARLTRNAGLTAAPDMPSGRSSRSRCSRISRPRSCNVRC
jgi:hypothetical protein